MPSRNDARLTERFGDELADRLLSAIKLLDEDFYASDACHVAENLQEMGELASRQFRQKHPKVPDDVVKAFAWCYTFDFK